jgi:hypothetical protein
MKSIDGGFWLFGSTTRVRHGWLISSSHATQHFASNKTSGETTKRKGPVNLEDPDRDP